MLRAKCRTVGRGIAAGGGRHIRSKSHRLVCDQVEFQQPVALVTRIPPLKRKRDKLISLAPFLIRLNYIFKLQYNYCRDNCQ